MSEAPKPYHHGDLRRALLETAIEMLAEEQGWQFTLRELARRAGVSHAAPYKHFVDKAALLAHLAALGFDRLETAMNDAERAHNGPREQFLARCLAYVGFGTQNRNLYRLMFSPDARSAQDPQLEARSSRAFEDLVDLMARGQAAGWLKVYAPRDQAVACWTQLHGLTLLSADRLLAYKWPDLDAAEAALEGLLGGLQDPAWRAGSPSPA